MELLIRPMHADDVAAAERLSGEAFLALDRARRTAADPEPSGRDARAAEIWRTRTAHFVATDPEGCWVAEQGGRTVGFATAFRRDLTWVLASFAVRPGLQGRGTGRLLLDAALGHAGGCLRGMLAASDDPRAFRRYRSAGFSLHPQLWLHGVVDRSALPVVEHVREGTPADFELMDSVDRRVRDAAHGVDHPVLHACHRLLVTDRTTGAGYAYVDDRGQPALLAATNRRTAARLLWEALASAPADEPMTIGHLTAVNEWAVDVGLAAGLSPRTSGYLALRGMKPPLPYVHHGSFL